MPSSISFLVTDPPTQIARKKSSTKCNPRLEEVTSYSTLNAGHLLRGAPSAEPREVSRVQRELGIVDVGVLNDDSQCAECRAHAITCLRECQVARIAFILKQDNLPTRKNAAVLDRSGEVFPRQ